MKLDARYFGFTEAIQANCIENAKIVQFPPLLSNFCKNRFARHGKMFS